ncbi:RNA-binding KH domain-containing protein RCF3-like [Vicia villosa]|uniref:RNA-binding KH domain-containing protein RCF3-like n=1 Tax=Vicia villosa TaxID=3911 RepID=UPI00273C8400|nr:RNA-binding KH domain-containing protein RCF3-like [Vicia villosa]XP_058768898.1 RNA-binding KH domain-containing protein RCF3-like [Vicia villosa]XP_058768902.1 RNA-binding KH domain-containing protein RCF3-like [Vicia villosa]XP_058768909.1 RNA-binding KH domain-containing protein RCF3-like [Vicia villosa]
MLLKFQTPRCCDECVVTVYSSSGETNALDDGGKNVSHAEDALFKIHDRVVAEELHSDQEEECGPQVTARLLVPADQIGCVLGKSGQIVQTMRSETEAHIRILKDDHMPLCALRSDEFVQFFEENFSQTIEASKGGELIPYLTLLINNFYFQQLFYVMLMYRKYQDLFILYNNIFLF